MRMRLYQLFIYDMQDEKIKLDRYRYQTEEQAIKNAAKYLWPDTPGISRAIIQHYCAGTWLNFDFFPGQSIPPIAPETQIDKWLIKYYAKDDTVFDTLFMEKAPEDEIITRYKHHIDFNYTVFMYHSVNSPDEEFTVYDFYINEAYGLERWEEADLFK